MDEKTYKSQEVADALGVSQPTIRKWITDGKLVGIFTGERKKKLVISESELKKFLDKNPKYREIWNNPMMREAPHDIKVYIQEKLKVLNELHEVLTTNQMIHLWSLRNELAIDNFVHDIITGKARIQ